MSTSSNLVAGDTNGAADVFLKNLDTGEVTLLSRSQAGLQANGVAGEIAVAADGTRILFSSTATNLVPTETIGFQNVYVKDIATGAVTLVSATAAGTAGGGNSGGGTFSPDGRSVAFSSTAANLVAKDLNGRQDVFLKNLDTGSLTPLSLNNEGTDAFSVPVTAKPSFGGDGSVVNFGQYSYALDNAGSFIVEIASGGQWYDLDNVSISNGDGSDIQHYDDLFGQYRARTTSVGIDYDRDGDFQTTITGLKAGVAVASQSFAVKVRAHAGSQTFSGDDSGELVLLSAAADKADGGGGDDILYGYGGRDELSGGAGNDTLDGGFGDDILRGGIGDDRYYVENAGDSVVEAAGAGRDTVFALYSATLAAHVEDLVLVGSNALTGTGNALANTITGNAEKNTLFGLDGDDVLDGGAGDDRMVGGVGNDRYIVDSLSDVVEELPGGGIDTIVANIKGFDLAVELDKNFENLILSDEGSEFHLLPVQGIGNASDNVIIGNQRGNKLIGGDGNDTLIGNGNNDNLSGGNGSDTLDGGEGGDYLDGNDGDDRLDGGVGPDTLYGGNGTDTLVGGADNDYIDGGVGADRMIGGAGDDLYVLSESGDQVTELSGEGIDTVGVDFDYALSFGSNVENIFANNGNSLKLGGNELDNRITGGAGDNVLDGGAGADTLIGGAGNDTYLIDSVGDVVQEASSSGSDTVIASVGFALTADAAVETLKFADNRAAGSLQLIGNATAQTLIGNGGASRLSGLGGDDTYLVDDGNDLVFEAVGLGNDTVVTTGSYTLGVSQEIETLRLAAAAGTDKRGLAGNAFANTLVGNAGVNSLDGGAGADALYGLGGDDTYLVDDAGDRVFERAGEGTDTIRASVSYTLAAGQSIETLELTAGSINLGLTGNDLANTLRDNAGDNRLDGGAGDDTLVSSGGRDVLLGGQGSDSAIIDRSGATTALRFVMASVNGTTTLVGDGTTTTSIGNITLTGGTGNDIVTTLDGTDVLNGGAGNDTLNGGIGTDRLIGGGGDDTFIVDNAGDRVVEAVGGGRDTVLASASHTLQAGQEIEALQLLASTGAANLNLTGNGFDQSLVGNNGANVLNGGGGADLMIGRGGDDTYVVDNAGDRTVEAAGGGRDTVLSSISYALAAGQEVEALQLLASTGSAALDLTGNERGQTLVGNNGANTLNGDLGNDALTGRGGADSFVFSTALGASNLDRIADFAAEDTIQLSKGIFAALAPGQLAAGAFKNLGTGAADADDRILYNQKTGDLWYDVDGSGSAAGVKFAVLDNKVALTAADVLVV